MATTTNYSWETPDDTDLVKDGAAAIRTLGGSIDTTVKALNPGTTAGDLDYYTSATAKTRLGIGTAGQVLAVNSGATAPEWLSISTGGYTQIATGTIASGGTNITSIPGTYRDLVLVLKNTRTNSDGSPIALRVNADDAANRYRNLESASGNNYPPDNSRWYLCSDQDSGTSDALIVVRLFDYANTTTWKMGTTTALSNDETTTTNFSYLNEILAYNQTSAISQLNILAYSGTISGGTYTLYGVK